MNHSVRKITEGAMMVALYGLILVINRQLAGMIEYYLVYVLPIPLVVYSARYGLKDSLVVAASIFFLAFMISLPQTYFYILVSLFTGMIYGSMVRRKVSNGWLILVSVGVSIVFNFLTTVIFAEFFGFDILSEIEATRQMMMELNTMMSDMSAGMQLSEYFFSMRFIVTLIILGSILNGLLEGLLVHLLSNYLLKRLKIEVHPIKPASTWRIPKWTGYAAFIAFSCGMMMNYVTIDETGQTVLTVVYLIGMIYLLVFGYIAAVLWGRKKFGKNVGLIVMLAALMLAPLALPLLSCLGFLYIATDMKQRLTRN